MIRHRKQTICSDDLFTREQVQSIVTLLNWVWPDPRRGVEELVEDFIRRSRLPERAPNERVVIWGEERPLALADSYARRIFTADGGMEVQALNSVCVDPAFRGLGLGREAALAAFARIGRGDFPLALFQTGVPQFYEKLGARPVSNRFINRRHPENPQANPWWEANVMIYPGNAPWPDGVIDLNGNGY
ncbi:MAG: GNAT family N-acetyltransferase [Calditrichaeota bacterium]|nr:GNAT family N-acetyltransferase [Calditrichota bacterium]MCB9089353.1 GNAT family N-acetyltransferase [Calditrichia bacterium]MCB0290429.1 GNAT family N-acetyltransferase [Calditrichota bacterium]MCB0295059.1 GNAT family N-acetyltransferase [Calditrichota bacterium]MCB0304133.1 GNAT family N-acetyltransferase [Calditrichota bacterium]